MKRHKTRNGRTQSHRSSHTPSSVDARPQGRFSAFEMPVAAKSVSSWPSISVCMIVKNEEANLRPCIESVGDLASEIIVVDTGSTDGTVSVARELGAQVHFFDWTGDFAVARNESIRHATGDWVFWLDADDRLSADTIAQLKRAASSGSAEAYLCLVSSRASGGSQDVTEHIRLFRNHLGIEFTSAVHETVYPDLVRLGLRLAYTDIAIEHIGYASPAAKREKAARNLAILNAQLELQPDNADLLFYRAQSRGLTGDTDGLATDLQRYLALTRAEGHFNFMRFWAYASLISLQQTRGNRESARTLLARALPEFPGHPNFLFEMASLHLAEGKTEQALQELREALATMQGVVRGFRPPEYMVEIRLADCLRALRRRQEALKWAEQSWHHAPTGAIGVGITLSNLYLENDRIPEAESLLDQLLSSVDAPEVWLALADLRHRQGRVQEAEEAVRTARSRGLTEDRAAPVLARIQAARVLANTRTQVDTSDQQVGVQLSGLALLSQGQDLKAAEHFAKAIEATPSDPDNYKYLAVALRKLGREEEALQAWELASRLLRQSA